jgi:hypothetical protein
VYHDDFSSIVPAKLTITVLVNVSVTVVVRGSGLRIKPPKRPAANPAINKIIESISLKRITKNYAITAAYKPTKHNKPPSNLTIPQWSSMFITGMQRRGLSKD